MIWTPRVTVAAVVERDGRFLMVEEQTRDGLVLNQPAGHLEDGESLLDAVRREVLEETARPFEPSAVTGLYRWRHPGSGDTYLRVCFTGEVGDELPGRPLDADIERTLWLDHAALTADPRRLRSPLVMRCIDDCRAGRRHPLDLLADLDSAD